jgi:DoxX-like family
MKTAKPVLAGWILSALLAAFLILASGVPKFIEWEGKEAIMSKLGWSTQTIVYIGIVEVAVALLFLIPRTAFLGAILLTGYLGGATATHVRVADPFFFPIVLGVLAWVALGLRDRRIFTLAFAGKP